MTPAPDVVALQAALNLNPTPGEWRAFYKHKYDEWHVSLPIAESSMRLAMFDDGIRTEHPEADAKLIAACSPDRITRVLAALRAAEQRAEAAEADAARYRWLRDTGAVFTVRADGDGQGCTLLPINRPASGLDAEIDAHLKQGEQPCEPL